MRSFEPLTPDQLEQITDGELLARYLETSQELGDPEAEALIVEMAKRDLDF